MRIFDSLLAYAPEDAIIEDVSIGIFWTFVKTQYGAGISATAHRWCEDPPGALIPAAGHLKGLPVQDLLNLYDSKSLTARALANAALAASISKTGMTGTEYPGRAQDLLDKICQGRPRHIALIGHFHFADDLRQAGHHLDVFELEGRCKPGDIPNTQIPEKLCESDIVVMTSSTLLTHTTEEIIACSHPEAYRMIVGPTVPLHPKLWDFGFDAICGSIIEDPEQVSLAVREGGNHKQLTGCRKTNFLCPITTHR